MSDNKTKALIFDFGGTLDTDGIHWSEKFRDIYKLNNIHIEKEIFYKAYNYSEDLANHIIKNTDSFFVTLQIKIRNQIRYFKEIGLLHDYEADNLTNEITSFCYNDVTSVIKSNKEILSWLKTKYKMGIISNFYGNMKKVLEEFELSSYFSSVLDSKIEGISKPDKSFFQKSISELNVCCSEAIVIGDSYDRDIIPAKLIGCKTVWLIKKSWYEPEDISMADYKIETLEDLLKLEVLFGAK